jgi:hypothetical protein
MSPAANAPMPGMPRERRASVPARHDARLLAGQRGSQATVRRNGLTMPCPHHWHLVEWRLIGPEWHLSERCCLCSEVRVSHVPMRADMHLTWGRVCAGTSAICGT